MTKTFSSEFDSEWVKSGRQYGDEELEGVYLGWEMRQVEIDVLVAKLTQLQKDFDEHVKTTL